MKKLLILLLSVLSLTAFADEVKLALLQPLTVPGSTACNPMEISMVRGELRKAFGWQSGFQVLTRLDVDAMLKEQGFQRSGMVDDNQRKEVGKMTGAQYICVSSITKYGSQLYIEAYLVDVETGQMTNPASQYANIQNEDYSTLPTSCNALAEEMLGEISKSAHKPSIVGHTVTSHRASHENYVETAYDVDMKMIWVEGGNFLMGCTDEQTSACHGDESVVRHVSVNGFFIGMLEVTQLQWKKVTGTSLYEQKNKSNPKWDYYGFGNDFPMYYVSWEEAMEFCRLLSNKTGKNYTLPTEAQWEYAARGGEKTARTKYAGSNKIDEVAWYTNNSSGTHVCGSKRANALGLYDMSGNVCEWCKDWYSVSYVLYDTDNPHGPSSGSEKVHRGGCWNGGQTYCRVSDRDCNAPRNRNALIGFRVICIPDK